MFFKPNDNLYLNLPSEMSDSDGICNKNAVCFKIEAEEQEDGTWSKTVLAELHCLSVDNDAACCVGIVMMEVINLVEMSEYLARYCWILQRRNQFCPIKQMAKFGLNICGSVIMLNSEINPTSCNNCVYSSQWLYSTCFGWQFHP